MEIQLNNNAQQLVQKIQLFLPFLDKSSPYWEILFPDKEQNWQHLSIFHYDNIFHISHSNSDSEDLEVIPSISTKVKSYFGDSMDELDALDEEDIEEWLLIIQAAINWLNELENNWLQANTKLQKEFPYSLRYGTIDFGILTHIVPEIKGIRHQLKQKNIDKILAYIKEDLLPFNDRFTLSSMTVSRYLNYCRIAYSVSKDSFDDKKSNEELYRMYADGRHEGLLDIDPDSEEEFANWLDHKHPKRQRGGHPWEIVRGGSYNHIGLRVMRPSFHDKDEFTIELYGFSEFRAKEYLDIYLAICEADLPVKLNQAENIQKRLLEQYRVGFIPSYQLSRDGYEYFPLEDDVLSIVYFEKIKQHRDKLLPFIRWNHLPLLKTV